MPTTNAQKIWAGLFAGAALLLLVIFVTVSPNGIRDLYDRWTKGRLIFRDEFDGLSFNTALWNTTIATSGVRYCRIKGSGTGSWIDISKAHYEGAMQRAPYGVATQKGGVVNFQTDQLSRTYPYIWAGAPSRKNPFPESGDFRFEVKLRYESLGYFGAGVRLRDWKNSDPIGSNSYGGEGRILTIRGASNGFRIGFLHVNESVKPEDQLGDHTIRLDCIGGEYSLFVDGELKLGPTASDKRPRMISIGDPLFAYSSPRVWPAFSVDYVHVRAP